MPERLTDWPPPEFSRHLLAKHPSPLHPETGVPVWESGIRLHGAQVDVVHRPWRFKQVRGGVRGGKSMVAALCLYLDYMWMAVEKGRENLLWWVIGPDYEQTREEMRHLHKLFSDAGVPHEFNQPKDGSWAITFPHHPGTEVVTKSAKELATIAGRAPRGIVVGEAAQCATGTFSTCMERVIQTRGWILLEGTFENAEAWYYQMAEEWSAPDAVGATYALPTWDNLVLFPGGRNDPAILSAEREPSMTPARFAERYGGMPTKSSRLVLPQADKRFHIAHRFPYLRTSFDPESPVLLAIDPGAAHAYSVFAFQVKKNLVWAIDAVYHWGRDAAAMVDEAVDRPWAKAVTLAVMDVAGEQQSSTGLPNKVQWQERWRQKMNQPLTVVTNRVPLQTGYDMHRRALLNSWPEAEAQRVFKVDDSGRQITHPDGPRLVFDPRAAAPMFGGVIDGTRWAGEYKLHVNPQRKDGSIPRDVPIDEYNDGVKSINYFLYWYFRASGAVRQMPSHTRPTTVRWSIEVAS